MDNANAYDIASKRILSKKSVLCNIMKECIPEYRDLSKEEIIKCIEDGSENEYIEGLNSEDIGINGQVINYDILFTSKLPDSDEKIGMYIDLEPQNDIYPGYELVIRALYYAARLIDRQKGEAFSGSNYNDIKKVYSIWICTNPKQKQKDCINSYTLQETNIKGDYSVDIDYKRMNIVMLYIGDNYDYKSAGILEMLSLIFKNTHLELSDVTRKLSDNYNINIQEREVQEVSNLSEGLIQQGELIGIEKGELIGIEKGIVKTVLNIIKSGISQEEAFRITSIDENTKQLVLEKLQEEDDV